MGLLCSSLAPGTGAAYGCVQRYLRALTCAVLTCLGRTHLCGLCDPQVTTLGIAIRIVGEYDSCRVLSAVIVFYSTTLQSYNYVEKLHVES